MFEEKVEIETCLSEHLSQIGTDINITPGHMISKSEIRVNRSDNDFIIICPPYFRKSFDISSIPGALLILRLVKAFVIDETCLSEHFSQIGTDINITPGHMEHMSTFVREMENDLSHGDNMFSILTCSKTS
jgi:hypothetical protein